MRSCNTEASSPVCKERIFDDTSVVRPLLPLYPPKLQVALAFPQRKLKVLPFPVNAVLVKAKAWTPTDEKFKAPLPPPHIPVVGSAPNEKDGAALTPNPALIPPTVEVAEIVELAAKSPPLKSK